MTCFEFEERLQMQLDLRMRSQQHPEELIAHATICGSCRSLLEQLQRIEAATARWQDIEPPPDFATAVLTAWNAISITNATQPATTPDQTLVAPADVVSAREFETHSSRPRAAVGPTSFALIASAIAVCVMLGVGLRGSRNVPYAQHRTTNDVTVANNHSLATEVSAAKGERQLDVLLHDAREAYSALASQALQHVSTANFLLPQTEAASPFRPNDAMNSFPDSFSRPLSPWGHELRDAFDSLLDRIFTSQDSST